MLRVAFGLCRIIFERFGELQFMATLVAHAKFAVAPRFLARFHA